MFLQLTKITLLTEVKRCLLMQYYWGEIKKKYAYRLSVTNNVSPLLFFRYPLSVVSNNKVTGTDPYKYR